MLISFTSGDERLWPRFGYIRTSTFKQSNTRQLQDIKSELDKVFEEKVSAKDRARPILKECLNYIRENDTLFVHSLDRLARSLIDLKEIVSQIIEKGTTVIFYKENMTFSKNKKANPMDQLLFDILGSFAAFERNLLLSRQAEGIAIAKKLGKFKGGIRRIDREPILVDLSNDMKKIDIAKKYKISCLSNYS